LSIKLSLRVRADPLPSTRECGGFPKPALHHMEVPLPATIDL